MVNESDWEKKARAILDFIESNRSHDVHVYQEDEAERDEDCDIIIVRSGNAVEQLAQFLQDLLIEKAEASDAR